MEKVLVATVARVVLSNFWDYVTINCTFNMESLVVTFTNIVYIHQSIDVKIDNPEQENIDYILPGQQYGINFWEEPEDSK